MEKLWKWWTDLGHTLFLNLKKIHLIIFRKSRQRLNLENALFNDNIKIKMKTHTKLLGILVDQKLIFEEHCKFIKGKIARGIGIFHKGKHITLFYVAHYAMGLYFFRIFLTRLWNYRKGLYALLMERENDHTAPIFEKYKLLNITYIYIYISNKYSSWNTTRKSTRSILSFFRHFFDMNNAVHEYYTRQE